MRIKSVFTAENNELVTMKSAREEEKKGNSENGRDKEERKQEKERER